MSYKDRRKIWGAMLNCTLIISMVVGLLSPALGASRASAAEVAAQSESWSFPGLAAQEELKELKDLSKLAETSVLSDISGHWAEAMIQEWADQGLVAGFEDGTFRPDQVMSRIEYVALVNRLFSFNGTSDNRFSDVLPTAWYASQVQAALKVGYIQGFSDGTFRPNQRLSRVDAAVILSRLVPVIANEESNRLGGFMDQASVPNYGRDQLEAIIEAGYMSGFTEGTIQPLQSLTRAEAVAILDRVLQQSVRSAEGITLRSNVLKTGGTWGPAQGSFEVAGDLTIQATGTILRNVTIKGDLTIDKAVGEGDVFLRGVTVLGNTYVNGGGENSIHIVDSNLSTVVIDRVDGRVRVVVGGTTVVGQMDIESEASIELNGTSDSKIEGILITSTGEVVLSGAFNIVEIMGDVQLTVSSGTIEDLQVDEGVTDSTITLASGVIVVNAQLHGATTVKGEGTITNALVDAANVEFETQPTNVEVTERGGSTGGGFGGGGGPFVPTNPPVDTAVVSVAVSQSKANSVRVVFSSAVPGLSAADFTLKNAVGEPIAVTNIGTLDSGTTYVLSTTLIEGQSYSITATKSGYSFGSAITFTVPITPPVDITVSASVYGAAQTTGFVIKLSGAAAGLTVSDFTLKHNEDIVVINGVSSTDGGYTYVIDASLAEGAAYTLTIAKMGYNFGAVLTITVSAPDAMSVTTSVYGAVSNIGFTVKLVDSVEGLTADNFALSHNGNHVGISEVSNVDGGETYAITAVLAHGQTYTLTIAEVGYHFSVLVFTAPGITLVAPSVSQLSPSGFILTMDKPVLGLEIASFEITDSSENVIGVNMLETVTTDTEFEVYTSFSMGETYRVLLNKDGYVFTEPLVLAVAAVASPSSVGWVSHEGLSVNFGRTVSGLSANQFVLEDEAGELVEVEAVQIGSDGKSAVIIADLSVSQTYSYRIVISDYAYSGTVYVPETVVVHRSTNMETAGLRVHLSIPVMGLTSEAFHLTHIDGTTAYTLDSVTTVDGSSYLIVPSLYSSASAVDYKLEVEYPGYSFGGQMQIIRPTLSYWGAKADPAFLTGLAPSVPGLTADNFLVMDEFGASVPIKEVFAEMGTQIVTFEGIPGSSYYVSVVKEGFDVGTPRKITVFADNTIGGKSYNGFTLMLNPPLVIDTVNGFILNRVNGVDVVGAPIGISVDTQDSGSSYQFAASLTPGDYRLLVDAPIEVNAFYFNIPVVATISVEQVNHSGITVSLDTALDGLNETSFQLVNQDGGASVGINSVTTNDQGSTYRIETTVPLQGGNYVVKLNGHKPTEGVPFQVQATLSSGAVTVGNVSNTGFDLTFGAAAPGLLPVNLDIRNSTNNQQSGITLSTSDGGTTYRVNVFLTSGQDYTLTMDKEYIDFGSPVSFHVGYIVIASITQVTDSGWVDFKLSPAMPQVDIVGLLVIDEEGNKYYDNYVMSAGGASFRFQIDNFSPDHTYSIDFNRGIGLDLDDYTLISPSFTIPSVITVTGATTSGVTVQFGSPIDSLTKSNFVIRGAAGETIPVTSAVTSDSGSNYVLTAALTAGKFYTVQYKSALASQATSTVEFVVQKSIAATILSVTSRSFKLQFSEKVAGLQFSQIILSEPSGTVIGNQHYSFETKDQGLSYEFRFSAAQTLGSGYMIDFARDEFKLAAPIAFNIPIEAMVSVTQTTGTELLLNVGSNYGSVPALSEGSFELRDSRGQLVTFSVTIVNSSTYRLTGVFDSLETYTLVTKYIGYDFGVPITFGLRIAVGIDTMFQTQAGFRMFLTQDVPGLIPSEITVKDDSGNTTISQSIVAMEFGSYQVQVPLSTGKIYTVHMNKTNYVTKYSIPFSLNKRIAYVDKVSNKGFRLNFDSALLWSSEVTLNVLNEGEEQTDSKTIVSWDGGLSYEIGIDLVPDEDYTVVISKVGDDFGSGIPLTVQSIVPSFTGMQPGDSRTFNLVFDQPVSDMRVSDFELSRASDGRRLPLLSAESSDGGTTYKLSAEFLETESYKIVPVKDGYYFGDPIAFSVPIIIRSAVMNVQPKVIEVALNPSVPDLDASNFSLLDNGGGALTVTSAVTEDEGATYRITAAFIGGQTYEVTLNKSDYDFSDELLAEIPSSIVSSIDSVSEAGITIALSPYVSGLSIDDFELKDENGNAVQITDASTANGGITYLLSAALTGGSSYTLTVSLAGYSFVTTLTAEVPIPVSVTYADIHAEGLIIQLDHSVPGLNNGNIVVLSTEGVVTTITALTSADGGLTYSAEADLEENKRYTLRLTKLGYDFGNDANLFVPIAVEKSVELLMTTGFTIELDEAILGLTASNFILTDSDGSGVSIVSWIGAEDGESYEVVADLIGHEVYTLQLIANGYDFGPDLQLEVLQPLVLSAQNITSTGFLLDIGDSVPYLDPNLVHLVNADGVRIGLDGSTFWDVSGPLQEGRVYQVFKPIALGEVYTVSVEDPAHPASGPLEVLIPHLIHMQIAKVGSSGIHLSFSQAVTGLQVKDITLLAEDGQAITIEDIVVGETEASYSIVASMVESRTYTLVINKLGYDFGASGEGTVLVPIRVTANVIYGNESGFTINLSEPIPELSISLFKDNLAQSISISTPDGGKTYNVGASWASDYPYTLQLNKLGYDLGIDQIIQYQKQKPMVIQAMSNVGGSSVLLTLDMPISTLLSNAGFAIKINGKWQGGVQSSRKDTSTIQLTWSGSTLKSTDEVIVAYTGINRVMAANGTYLAPINEMLVVNVSSTLGMIHSYLASNNFITPATKLRDEYSYSALETAELLQDGGFAPKQYAFAISYLYNLSNTQVLQVIHDIDADAWTAFKALRGLEPLPDHPRLWVAGLKSVGYGVRDIAAVFRDNGYPIRQIVQSFSLHSIPATEAAEAMRYALNELSSSAVAELKPFYHVTDIASSIQATYGLTDAETVKALFAGGVIAADASAAIRTLYTTDALVSVDLLRGVGYSVKDIGGAMSGYGFADVATAVQAFRGVGMNAQEIFLIVIGMYSHTDTATAMLSEGISEIEVAKAVQASGIAGAGAAIHAMRVNGYDNETTARIVLNVWGNSLTLHNVAKEFIQGGFSKETTVSMLRIIFGADVSSAFTALKPHYHSSQYHEMLFNVLIDGEYDPVEVAEYYIKQVYRNNRLPVLDHFISKDLNTGRLSNTDLISQSLKAVHDAVTNDGTVYPMLDAVRDLRYGRILYPQDVLTALRTAYAADVNSEPSVYNLAVGMSEYYTTDQIGLAMRDWITLTDFIKLLRTDALARRGCPCDAPGIVRHTKFVFGNMESITIGLSQSGEFTLTEIIAATLPWYPGTTINEQMTYMASVLRNMGYPFVEIAGVYEDRGMDWIEVFSRYAIAAKEVASILKSKGRVQAEIIDELRPYPLSDIALVLRELYELDESAAIDALLSADYDQMEVGRAIARAYGGDPVALWVKSLRAQGATADSVLTTITSHYPEYRDASAAGLALVKGGYSTDEVMKALITLSSILNLQNTIAVLNALFDHNQVSIAQLLTASSSDTPERGIVFLRNAKYSLFHIIRSLKEYYGLDSGVAVILLDKYYQGNLSVLLDTITDVYGGSKEVTATAALDAQGIVTLAEAIPYLKAAGYGIKDIARLASNHIGTSIGQTADRLTTSFGNGKVVIYAVAEVYGQSIESTIYELLLERGITNFAGALQFTYGQQFDMRTAARMSKEQYGLSAGDTMRELRAIQAYADSGAIASTVGSVYEMSHTDSIAASLPVNDLTYAIAYLVNMEFDLISIIHVGKRHYNLDMADVSAALTASGLFDGTSETVITALSQVYGQVPTVVVIDLLDQLGANSFADAIDVLHPREVSLIEIIRVAISQYELTAGETIQALYESQLYATSDIVSSVAEVYGKPFNESLLGFLEGSGLTTVEEAASMLRQFGYTLRDVIVASKEYYGKSASEITAILSTMNFYSSDVVEFTVNSVYGQTAATNELDVLAQAGITNPQAAATHLWNAGYTLIDITRTLKTSFGRMPGEAVSDLLHIDSNDIEGSLYTVNVVYGGTIDTALITVLKREVGQSPEAAAESLSKSGYSLRDIVSVMKNNYSLSSSNTSTIMNNLNTYDASVIVTMVDSVYENSTPTGTMSYILDLYEITTAQGTVQFMKNTNATIKDVAMQLKNRYELDSVDASELLRDYYQDGEVTLAIASVYYFDTSLRYLAEFIPSSYASSPYSTAKYMSESFGLTNIILAMKLLFNLDSLGAMDVMSEVYLNDTAMQTQVYNRIIEVYGNDPVYAKLARMAKEGHSANNLAVVMDSYGKLDLDSEYLVNTLDALGYSDTTILNVRYAFFNLHRGNVGSPEVQADLLLRFGLHTPTAMASFLRNKTISAYHTMNIIRLALPEVSTADIALGMAAGGVQYDQLNSAMGLLNEFNGEVAGILMQLGYTARAAADYLDRFFPVSDQVRFLESNGYKMSEYLRYTMQYSSLDGELIAALREHGYTAEEIGAVVFESNVEYFRVANALRNGGFTDPVVIINVLVKNRLQPIWVIRELKEMYTIEVLAQAMFDTGTISLPTIVNALEHASVNRPEIYRITKLINKDAIDAYLSGMSFAERKALEKYAELIVTIGSLESAGFSAYDSTKLLSSDISDFMTAAALMIISGYEWDDAMGAIWDVYRLAIGVFILEKMMNYFAGNVLSEMKQVWDMVKRVKRLVKVGKLLMNN